MNNIKREKHEIDATGMAPGRLATKIAVLLIGKHKKEFQPHIDMGDSVVVLNAKDVKFTGKKLDQKIYYKHSGHPGGLKETPAKKLLSEKPQEVVRKAVYNMLPKNKLRNDRMKRLKFK